MWTKAAPTSFERKAKCPAAVSFTSFASSGSASQRSTSVIAAALSTRFGWTLRTNALTADGSRMSRRCHSIRSSPGAWRPRWVAITSCPRRSASWPTYCPRRPVPPTSRTRATSSGYRSGPKPFRGERICSAAEYPGVLHGFDSGRRRPAAQADSRRTGLPHGNAPHRLAAVRTVRAFVRDDRVPRDREGLALSQEADVSFRRGARNRESGLLRQSRPIADERQGERVLSGRAEPHADQDSSVRRPRFQGGRTGTGVPRELPDGAVQLQRAGRVPHPLRFEGHPIRLGRPDEVRTSWHASSSRAAWVSSGAASYAAGSPPARTKSWSWTSSPTPGIRTT